MLSQLDKWGCDTAAALERFVDDKTLYISCLRMFSQDPYFQKLQQEIRGNDYKAAFGSAHTLKGVAGNLGLTPLYTDLSDIMEALRLQQDIRVINLLAAILNFQSQLAALGQE